MNSLNYLISNLLNLYIMLVILRLWLQATRADFYNPLSQFIVKVTQPILGPLRRVIPSIGMIDSATLLLAYALCVFKLMLLTFITNGYTFIFSVDFLFLGLLSLIKTSGYLLFWVLLIRAIMSWVSQGRSSIEHLLYQLTEPMLAPIRRLLPDLGGLDLSVLVLFILLQFSNYLMRDIFGMAWLLL